METRISRHMLCKCGAINELRKILEKNEGFTNSYICPGGFRKDGRYSPAHIEPNSSIARNVTETTTYDDDHCFEKLWKRTENCLDLAREAEPELWRMAENMAQDGLVLALFLDYFVEENLGRFCHQVPIPDFQEWTTTSIDAMDGASLPYSRKTMPHNLTINEVKFQREQLRNLIDLRNVVIWDLEAFYGQD